MFKRALHVLKVYNENMLTDRTKLTLVVFIVVVLLLVLVTSVLWVKIKLTSYEEVSTNTYTGDKNKVEYTNYNSQTGSDTNKRMFESSKEESRQDNVGGVNNLPIKNVSKTELYGSSINNLYLSGQDITSSWVIVDCNKKLILKCPHGLVLKGTTPIGQNSKRTYLHGRCRDVSVDVGSFCGF